MINRKNKMIRKIQTEAKKIKKKTTKIIERKIKKNNLKEILIKFTIKKKIKLQRKKWTKKMKS